MTGHKNSNEQSGWMGLAIYAITRDYLAEHFDDFIALEHNWTEIGESPWNLEQFFYELPHKWDLSQAAKFDSRLVGYIIGSCPQDGCKISRVNKVIVDKPVGENESSYRGKGIGRSLLDSYLNACTELEVPISELKVLPANIHAVNLYEHAGYRKVGEELGDDDKLRLVYQKNLGWSPS